MDKNKGERKRGENRKLGVGERDLGGVNMIKIHCITVSKINESIVSEKK